MIPLKSETVQRAAVVAILVAAAVGLFAGWRLFWFLTDDAHIAFRYVSNSVAGYGYVWNAPPFRPVEGYTSFLWVVLLDAVWRIFGTPPPASANWLALVFTYLNLLLASVILYKLSWPERLRRYRPVILFLFVVFLLTNRSFLAWASSGLETALFCLLVTVWVYSCLFVGPKWRSATISTTASLLALTRPDGLLFVAASIVLVFLPSERNGDAGARRRFYLSLLPFGIVPIHLVWRFVTYGEWLPNTYYAKTVSVWPQSGIRYAGSFVLEFGLWLWLALILVWAGRSVLERSDQRPSRRRGAAAKTKSKNDAPITALGGSKARLVMVVATLLAHAGYYTLIIGGDHFEYRVYNHLIPLIFVSFVAVLLRLTTRPRVVTALSIALILVGLPIPWTHWSLTHKLHTRKQTYVMVVPIADHWPGAFRWYARWFDELQGWLIPHHVCMRHQEHKIFYEYMTKEYPSREEGSRIMDEGYPVYVCTTVGVPGWVLPHVNIIDKYGLNDYVIARMPVEKREFRMMAHERRAPREYLDGFLPNVEVKDGRVWVNPRPRELTAADIIAHEAEWERIVREEQHESLDR